MKRFILIVSAFFYLQVGFSQSGYLGKNNGLDLRILVGPSYRMVNEIDNLDRSVQRIKLATSSYSLSYSRVLSRNFELSLGYQFANIQCMAEDKFFNERIYIVDGGGYNERLLNEPRIKYHGGVIGFNFYRLGSIAPIGKYVGFSFSFGRAFFDSTNTIVVGERDNNYIKNSFFKTVSNINSSDSISLATTGVNNWNLKARFGRNYPLTDFLILSVGMSFPIISSYTSGLNTQFGFQLKSLYQIDHNGNWTRYFMNSVKTYHRVTIDIGLKFLF